MCTFESELAFIVPLLNAQMCNIVEKLLMLKLVLLIFQKSGSGIRLINLTTDLLIDRIML